MNSTIKLFLHLGHSDLLMGGIFASEQDFFLFKSILIFLKTEPLSLPLKGLITFLICLRQNLRDLKITAFS